jgi:hypothetical protein
MATKMKPFTSHNKGRQQAALDDQIARVAFASQVRSSSFKDGAMVS